MSSLLHCSPTMCWVGVMVIQVLTAASVKWNGIIVRVAGLPSCPSREEGRRSSVKIAGASVGRRVADVGFSGAFPHRVG